MQEISLGTLTSLIYCKKCGMPIEIYANQEKVICENCNTNISLKALFGMDLANEIRKEKNQFTLLLNLKNQ